MRAPFRSFAFSAALITPWPFLAAAPEALEYGYSASTFIQSAALDAATGLDWAPDGSDRLFVIRKSGVVRIIESGTLAPAAFAGLSPVFTNSECGLVGMAFDPDFTSNGHVFFFVTVSATEQRIVRYTDSGGTGTAETAIVSNLPCLGQNHDGGGLAFGGDGMLYFGIGDLGGARVGVDGDLTSLASKVGRVTRSGQTAPLNPFDDGPGPNDDRIWARGFRNPFTMTYRASDRTVWANVTGDLWEQAFRLEEGAHAGWDDFQNDQPPGFLRPSIAYRTNTAHSRQISKATRKAGLATFTTTAPHGFRPGHPITISGMSDPSFDGEFAVFDAPGPSRFRVRGKGPVAQAAGGTATLPQIGGALTGGCFWESTGLNAAHRGNFFFCDFNSGAVFRAALGRSGQVVGMRKFASGFTLPVDAAPGPDGALYVLEFGGRVTRIAHDDTLPRIVLTPYAATGLEGGKLTVSISLSAQPPEPVTITATRSAGSAAIALAGISQWTFTPSDFADPQPVGFTLGPDADLVDDEALFEFRAPGFLTARATIHAVDTTPAVLRVSSAEVALREGGTRSFRVNLASDPGGPVTVTTARVSGNPSVTVASGASLAFDSTNYAIAQSVTLAAAKDQDGLPAEALFAVTSGSETRLVRARVADTTRKRPRLSGTFPASAIVGNPISIPISARGNPEPLLEATSIPGGSALDPAATALEWTPQTTGTARFKLRAVNGVGKTATLKKSVVVLPDSPPVASLTKPAPGDTVSGAAAEFFGDGLDDVGCVRAEFYVDGALAYTDVNGDGHYHFGGAHNLWDTTAIPNGQRTLTFRVFDTRGQSGETSVTVTVAN